MTDDVTAAAIEDAHNAVKALIRLAVRDLDGEHECREEMVQIQEQFAEKHGEQMVPALGYFLASAAANGLREVARLHAEPVEKVITSYETHLDFTALWPRIEGED